MGESATSMFRRGMISPKQAAKLKVLKGTKAQASKMAPFDGKQGKSDQGGVRGNRGVVSRDAINQNQSGGRASKGGGAGPEKQPIKVKPGVINDPALQQPKFPRGSEVKGSNKGNPKRSAKIDPSGPIYGGPNGRP